MQYSIRYTERMFTVSKSFMAREIQRGCAKSGVKRIRVHYKRHSHASLLIELGLDAITNCR